MNNFVLKSLFGLLLLFCFNFSTALGQDNFLPKEQAANKLEQAAKAMGDVNESNASFEVVLKKEIFIKIAAMIKEGDEINEALDHIFGELLDFHKDKRNEVLSLRKDLEKTISK